MAHVHLVSPSIFTFPHPERYDSQHLHIFLVISKKQIVRSADGLEAAVDAMKLGHFLLVQDLCCMSGFLLNIILQRAENYEYYNESTCFL